MRTVGALLHYTQVSQMTSTTKTTIQHSPVLYVFGGLAAVLVSIALALLILACSSFDQTADNGNTDVEKGESSSTTKSPTAFEQKFVVIMAGQVRPTFLATPVPISREKDEENIERKVQTAESQVNQEQSH